MDEFRNIYNSAFPVLYRVAYRITNKAEAAEDLCHDAFCKLFEKNMVFPNPDEAKYWLIRVVKNASLNYTKRNGCEQKAYQKSLHEAQRQEETGETSLVNKETRAEIHEAIKKLPERLRITLKLKIFAQLKYREIGQMLGISEGNVKTRIIRARKRLGDLLLS